MLTEKVQPNVERKRITTHYESNTVSRLADVFGSDQLHVNSE